MKFCKNCGNQIDDNAILCPRCGARANGDGPNVNYGPYGGGFNSPYGYQPVYDTAPSKAIAVLSFLFWQVGLVVWLFCRRTRPGKARSAVKGLLSSACVGMPVIGAVLWILWKDDLTKRDLAKISAVSAIVGAGIYALLIILSMVLTFAGLLDAGWYFSIPTGEVAAIMSFFR